ncbi:hypothetical protein HCN44_006022 [Aphidius gifuensis]
MYERTCVLIFILLFTILPSYINCNMWPKKDHYNTRWDKMNLDKILENKRLLRYYFNCLMSKGPCPPDGQVLKKNLPEALKTACEKCSKSQKDGGIKVIKYLREYEPKIFEILASKYDPKGTYRRRYLKSEADNTT